MKNYQRTSFEERTERFGASLKQLLDKENIDKFNLVSFSYQGLESRAILEDDCSIKEKLNKFLMIGCPNKGSTLGSGLL